MYTADQVESLYRKWGVTNFTPASTQGWLNGLNAGQFDLAYIDNNLRVNAQQQGIVPLSVQPAVAVPVASSASQTVTPGVAVTFGGSSSTSPSLSPLQLALLAGGAFLLYRTMGR